MDDKFVSSMPSQSFDKALEGGLKFYNGEFVSEEQKQALTGPQGPQGEKGETGEVGPQGPAYTLTDTDKNTIAAAVKASLTTETWTFTLEDGSTVTKAVYVG